MTKEDKKLAIVTGGAGFVGSHLCERLVKEGYRVISLDNYFTGSKDNHVEGVEYHEGHTKDIAKHIPEDPDIIYHLGEYARVEQSLLEKEVVYDLNTEGTEGVLAFWQNCKCKLVYAGSSTKFGDSGTFRTKTPYARTKAENTEKVYKIGEDKGLPYAITYFYNVYGPRERSGIYGTLIEIYKQMYLSGMPFAVTSPGTQTRNFTHVYDIVDALILVGEQGHGDEYGLGNEKSYTILEVANMFSDNIVMLPERAGNRMSSGLDTTKIDALGWKPTHTLEDYVQEFLSENKQGAQHEKRILVVSTTFYPVMGPAERALAELVEKIPDVHFDIVTTRFSKSAPKEIGHMKNVHIYRVGFGNIFDKYLLPFAGFFKGNKLCKKHNYLFAWSIMASYAALAGVFLKHSCRLPFLITLADQSISDVSPVVKVLLKTIMTSADQVYGADISQDEEASRIKGGELRRSIGEGDAFANQLRYAYAEILLTNQSY